MDNDPIIEWLSIPKVCSNPYQANAFICEVLENIESESADTAGVIFLSPCLYGLGYAILSTSQCTIPDILPYILDPEPSHKVRYAVLFEKVPSRNALPNKTTIEMTITIRVLSRLCDGPYVRDHITLLNEPHPPYVSLLEQGW